MTYTYRGNFEAHITLQNYENTQKERFLNTANQLNVKAIVIELARGDVPIQPMTCSFHQGEYETVKKEVEQLAKQLEIAGFSVSRLKIEASPWNEHIPQTSTEAANHSPKNYFEHHTKIEINENTSIENLLSLCQKHQAHLSKNAFKSYTNGLSEHFITLRHYTLGLQESQAQFQLLQNELAQSHYVLLKNITEYCIYDSKVEVDNNWLTLNCMTCEKNCDKEKLSS
ncbi:MAG: hypothetical protein ACKVTZ_18150 [Bacteroidia bacterium]